MRNLALIIGMLTASLVLMACGTQTRSAGTTPTAVSAAPYRNVTPAELDRMLAAKDFILVNVHVPYAGELAQTDAFIPYTDIEQSLSKLPADKNAKIVLYCSSGHMSGIAANALVKLGYTNIWNLDGGMAAWQNAGYSLVQKKQ